tara:strand:+ start:12431 stop:13789 length:1359 start_codon:yes stop_codon:yes gene_type:complete
MFAIIDIETTGGKFNEEAITEIAIFRYENFEIKDQLISLIKPDRKIQPYVSKLTGIKENMLLSSPKFYEIAKQIIEITSNCTIVAHNAEFDYRMLKLEFKRLGYSYRRKFLCTVKLSQKLIPDLDSYKLDKLVKKLGIPISNRHRAFGDATATLKLFELLLQKDKKKLIINELIDQSNNKIIKSKFLKIIDQCSTETGVYYIHDKKSIIYIGKSNNIQKRIRNHLTSDDSKSNKIKKNIEKVTFEVTGSEIIALLKEDQEIKENQPKFNYKNKYRFFPIGIRLISSKDGYLILKVEQILTSKKYFHFFKTKYEAINKLRFWIEKYKLCENLSPLSNGKKICSKFHLNLCSGACFKDENKIEYNKKVNSLINDMRLKYETFLMIDKGRNINEKSFVLVKNDEIKGYGYYELNHQINNIKNIKNRIVEIDHNNDSYSILNNYIRQNKHKYIIEL